ncbi:hypothetical protein SAMN05877753_112121 [Bacillus oleivorans]|uniref:DUF5367 domain-containing protein n=1 Tax=Bacillus oleivorans TaxID=1448271 RepID=A0A285D7Z4_9BACI|nr:DUF5367 family protein [Bacillus oleivorans]SNX75476.1 hypothetical protein SAMN05877753_112121 [Bacillus oleivorans]
MKNYFFTGIWGVLVWAFATLFFVIFGENVLFSPGTNHFFYSLCLLIVGTGVLLWGVTYIYLLFDKTENAALKFGLIGTIIGLTLDTISLSNHSLIFPKLNDSQVIAFTSWMSFAYALYLVIPAMIYQIRKN